MMNSQQIGVEFRLPAKIRKKGRWYVSSCPPLDVHSQGHTKEEARRNLIDALVFFLESCFERGTLEEVLRDEGHLVSTVWGLSGRRALLLLVDPNANRVGT